MDPIAVGYHRHQDVLNFLRLYQQKHGFSPTLQEIADGLGLRSPSTIHEHLATMVRKGIIRIYPGQQRRIEIIEKVIRKPAKGITVPILGFIAAGQPIEPYRDPNATTEVPPKMLSGKKRAFVLEVRGNSMVEDGILDGDFVIVEEAESANNGDIVVALLENGLATLKRFFKETTRVRLEPANAKMAPIFATDVRIQGRVVGVVRKF